MENKARLHSMDRHGVVWYGKACPGLAGEARHVSARRGKAWPGRHGEARRSQAWSGESGMAWLDRDRLDKAWHGEAGMTDIVDWETELARWDASFAPRGSVPRSSTVYNGRYTLKFTAGGCPVHRTFRIHTKGGRGPLAGKRILSLLVAADNDDDASYRGFGFVNDHGVKVWKNQPSGMVRFADLIWRLANGEVIDGYELLVERRCFVCNRPLTDPISIECGIGPTCRKRMEK